MISEKPKFLLEDLLLRKRRPGLLKCFRKPVELASGHNQKFLNMALFCALRQISFPATGGFSCDPINRAGIDGPVKFCADIFARVIPKRQVTPTLK